MSHDFVCATDGAWGINPDNNLSGAIGGRILDKTGKIIHVFSKPVMVKNVFHAEVEAIKYIMDLILSHNLPGGQVAICSDCTEAIQFFRKGASMSLYSKHQSTIFDFLLNSTVSLFYVPRELNIEADALAKGGLHRALSASYWEL